MDPQRGKPGPLAPQFVIQQRATEKSLNQHQKHRNEFFSLFDFVFAMFRPGISPIVESFLGFRSWIPRSGAPDLSVVSVVMKCTSLLFTVLFFVLVAAIAAQQHDEVSRLEVLPFVATSSLDRLDGSVQGSYGLQAMASGLLKQSSGASAADASVEGGRASFRRSDRNLVEISTYVALSPCF